MKNPLIILPLLAMSFLTIYSMNKETPENALAVFGNTYLMNLKYVKSDENGDDYYLEYTIITGDYPKWYYKDNCSLHVIPQDSVCRLETRLYVSNGYGNGHSHTSAHGTRQYYFKGYSNDENLLEAKILKYYLENKDKTEK
jgi:hypothetical protein